jgi:DNA-binding NtrC family response regulator
MKSKLRFVMVEDSEADAELVARRLIKAGLDLVVHRVETEPDFVEALQKIVPDIILSDFSLPQFDGLRALDIAVVHAPDTPFIFVSGTIGEERALDALRRGATDYVLKTNLARLPAAVERALRDVSLKAAKAKSEQQRYDQEIRLQRLTRTYRMLSSTSSAILRLRNRKELLEEVCRIASEQGGYDRVVISLIDPDARTLRPRAWAGTDSVALRAADCVVLDTVHPQ